MTKFQLIDSVRYFERKKELFKFYKKWWEWCEFTECQCWLRKSIKLCRLITKSCKVYFDKKLSEN